MSPKAAQTLFCLLAVTAPVFCQGGLPGMNPINPIVQPPPIHILPGLTTDPLVIASIGDSNAAGEGGPNSVGSSPSIWSLAQCHRSENSGRTLAANALGKLTDLEYSNFACSGGAINVGLLGPYVGLPVNGTFQDALPAQVQQVQDWMNQNLRRRNLDVLIISIGVNDVGFSQVVGKCLSPFENCSNDAHLNSIISDGDPDHATEVLGLSRLSGALDQLATTIKEQLHPRYVLVTEYPDNLHDEKGNFCNAFDEHFEVAPEHLTWGNIEPTTGLMKWLKVGGAMKEVFNYESQFLENNLVNPLNTKLQQAVHKHASDGWIYVGGMVEMTRPHGFCSTTPWFNTVKTALHTQGDLDGTAHLNKTGQKAYQWLLQKKIIELFNIPSAPPVEMFDNQVTNVYIGDTKRVVIEVSPTVDFVSGEIQYKLRTTPTGFSHDTLSVPLKKDNSFAFRQVYYADLPTTETLGYEESFDYRPVIHYGRNQNALDGFIAGELREYVVFRYQEISDN